MPGDALTKVREHIESFPFKYVHYYNKDTSSYLDGKLNVKITYLLYEQKYPDHPVKYKFYLKYFQENFTIESLGQRKNLFEKMTGFTHQPSIKNFIAEANKNVEIRSPKTEDIRN